MHEKLCAALQGLTLQLLAKNYIAENLVEVLVLLYFFTFNVPCGVRRRVNGSNVRIVVPDGGMIDMAWTDSMMMNQSLHG